MRFYQSAFTVCLHCLLSGGCDNRPEPVVRRQQRLEPVLLSLNHSVRDPESRSARKAVKSDALASVETSDKTGDAAGGHWSRTLRASCFLATIDVVSLARTLRYALHEPTWSWPKNNWQS